ncbi:condensation domain-containing protein [Streptomyces nogalater]
MSAGTAERLRALPGARWSLPVIAAMAAYTHRTTGAADVVLRVFLAARTNPDALATPAMLVNDLPLRLTVRPSATFTELVAQVRDRLAEAVRHQRFPGERIRRELGAQDQGSLSGPTVNVLSFAPGRPRSAAPGPPCTRWPPARSATSSSTPSPTTPPPTASTSPSTPTPTGSPRRR